MRQLFALTVILIVVGVASFMYRNALEHPATPSPEGVACTMEAKLCPDGSAVGRSGPNCEFAACAFPNAKDETIGIAFVVPAGYTANPDAIGTDETLRAVFDKPSKGNVPHSIVIRRFLIPAGKSADETVLAQTMFESSGKVPTSMKEFVPVVINGRTFQKAVLERFEGQIHSVYYLERASDVLRFEVLEKDIDWTNPNLVVEELPEHKALLHMLASLQTTL